MNLAISVIEKLQQQVKEQAEIIAKLQEEIKYLEKEIETLELALDRKKRKQEWQ